MALTNLELARRANYGVEVDELNRDAKDHGCLWFYGPRVGSEQPYVWLHYPHAFCDKYRVSEGLTEPHVFETNDFGSAMDMVCALLRQSMVTPDVYIIGELS